jgi:hypothetical protein
MKNQDSILEDRFPKNLTPAASAGIHSYELALVEFDFVSRIHLMESGMCLDNREKLAGILIGLVRAHGFSNGRNVGGKLSELNARLSNKSI